MPSIGTLISAYPNKTLKNIIDDVDLVMPKYWKIWKVNDLSAKVLLGDPLDFEIVDELQFAIPTVAIARAFKVTELTEENFRIMKLKMMDWPPTRSLLYAPHFMAHSIHGDNIFCIMNSVRRMRRHLLSLRQANKALRKESRSSKRPSPTTRDGQKKRVKFSDEVQDHGDVVAISSHEEINNNSDESIMESVFMKQADMFKELIYTMDSSTNCTELDEEETSGAPPEMEVASEDSAFCDMEMN